MARSGPLPDDVVRAATVWTDGSADFTFVDGTVAAFGPRADTVVFLRPAGAADPNWDMHVRGGSMANATAGSLDCPCAPKSAAAKDMYFTALSLTKDEAKLRGALEILSTLLPRPKLISGLLPKGVEEQAWTASVPIDSVLVRAVPASAAAAALSLPANVERLGNGGIRVWDEYRTTSLTLHPNGAFVTVRWPAKVYDRDGVSTTFVSGADVAEVSAESIDVSGRAYDRTANASDVSGGPSTAAAAAALARARAPRVKATRFAMLTQHFPASLLRSSAAASPMAADDAHRRAHGGPQPRLDFAALHCWAVMLHIAETWRDASAALLPDEPEKAKAEGVPGSDDAPPSEAIGSDGPEGGATVHCLQLPGTLVPVDKTDSIARFATLEAHHAASLVASANFLHSAACAAAAHPAPVAVAARFLHGEAALWATPDSGFTAVSGCLLRDLSHFSLTPRGCPHGEIPNALPQAFDSRHDAGPSASVWLSAPAAEAREPTAARTGSASPARPAGEDEESPSSAAPGGEAGPSAVPAVTFLYAADQTVPVPAPAGESRAARACGVHGGTQPRRAGELRSVVSKSLGLACAIAASVSQCNHSRARVSGAATRANGYGGGVANAIAESRRGLNTSVGAASGGVMDGRGGIVRCGSYVPSVGKFTAFADGAIRVCFDDRTIVTVVPAPGSVRTLANGGQLRDDSESHVDVVERSANRRAVRLAQIHPGHELYPYVQHAMAFAQFAELPDDSRQSLASADESAHQSPPQYSAQLAHDPRRESAADLEAAIVRTRMLLKES